MNPFRTKWLLQASVLTVFALTPIASQAQQSLPSVPTDAECEAIMSDMGLPPGLADTPANPAAPGTGTPGAGAPGAGTPGTGTPATPGTGAPGTGAPGDPSTSPPAGTPGSDNPSTPAPVKPQPKPQPKPAPSNPGIAMPNGSAASCAKGISMAQSDRASVQRAKAAQATLKAAASRYGIDWRLLAAVGVRETNFRMIDSPRPNDTGWGVFQITNHAGVSRAQAHDLTFAANYAAKLLKENISYMKRNFPNFTQAQVLQAAAAAYNFGPKNVKGNPANIDKGTTGNNYGQSVILLMNCY